MAYNEFLADRIRQQLNERKIAYSEIKMMGGLCFMVDEKMCCGVIYNRKNNLDLLMARIGEEAFNKNQNRAGCRPMDFTGRPMKGYVFVDADGFDFDEDLAHWIDLCISFNPFARSSKKKS